MDDRTTMASQAMDGRSDAVQSRWSVRARGADNAAIMDDRTIMP
ncbi:MAG: hypothetical protein ACREP2_03565 [Rhodanobacteraceae bacterium]